MHRSIPLLLILLVSLPAFAAEVNLKPVYLQPLKHTVILDGRGNTWFVDDEGFRDAANNRIGPPPEKGEPLLVDRSGRIWWKPSYAYGGKLSYFDGKGWQATKLTPDFLHEDSAGRVFAVTHRQVGDKAMTNTLHVFADGKWSEEGLPDRVVAHGRVQAFPRFAADPKGRTWFWLEQYREWGLADPAAWVFDGEKWSGHPVTGRRAGEAIDLLLPFADDWFLVLVSRVDEQRRWHHRALAWSPSRKSDEIEKANPFDGLPLTELSYRGTDADGVRHFRWLDRNHPDMPRWQIAPTTPPYLAVAPDRKVKKLTEEQGQQAAARLGGARHPQPNFGKTDLPPVLPFPVARVIGKDKDGRIYLENGNENLTSRRAWVVWPEKEKPGDVLRLATYPTTKPTEYRERETFDGLFADARGVAFARPYYSADTIVCWDGKKWAETPIRPLPQAHWMARPAPPPEYGWANFRWVGHSLGTDGRTLFARVKTKYVPEKDVADPLREQTKLPKVDADTPFYQYEMWTHLDGAWGVARPPAELIRAKRKDLIAGMTATHTPLGPTPVISDGRRLWYAIDWKLYTMDVDGTVHSADLPKPAVVKESDDPRQKFAPLLMLAAFAKRDDKSFVLAVAGPETKTYKVHFWGGKPAGVRVEELAPLPLPFAVVHHAADGTVLAWVDNQARGYPLLPDGQPPLTKADPRAVYRLRDGKWEEIAKVGQPLGIAPDGTLWCPPYQPYDDADARIGKAVLYRVSGEKAERVVWGLDEVAVGFEKPGTATATFVLPQYGLANLEPGKEGAKPTLRVRYTGPLTQLEQRRSVVTASGHLLLPTEWGTLFDPKVR